MNEGVLCLFSLWHQWQTQLGYVRISEVDRCAQFQNSDIILVASLIIVRMRIYFRWRIGLPFDCIQSILTKSHGEFFRRRFRTEHTVCCCNYVMLWKDGSTTYSFIQVAKRDSPTPTVVRCQLTANNTCIDLRINKGTPTSRRSIARKNSGLRAAYIQGKVSENNDEIDCIHHNRRVSSFSRVWCFCICALFLTLFLLIGYLDLKMFD